MPNNYVVEMNTLQLTLKFYFETENAALEYLEASLKAHSDTDDGVIVKFSIYEETP